MFGSSGGVKRLENVVGMMLPLVIRLDIEKRGTSPISEDYNCKNCTKVFHSREEAVADGYSPCGVCRP
jgi:hypothetical protein